MTLPPGQLRKPLGQLIQKQRDVTANFDLYEVPGNVEIFADGATQIMSGPFVTKVFFHKVDAVDGTQTPPFENRIAVGSLTMPTNSFLVLAQFILQTIVVNKEQLIPAYEQMAKSLSDMTMTDAPIVENPK